MIQSYVEAPRTEKLATYYLYRWLSSTGKTPHPLYVGLSVFNFWFQMRRSPRDCPNCCHSSSRNWAPRLRTPYFHEGPGQLQRLLILYYMSNAVTWATHSLRLHLRNVPWSVDASACSANIDFELSFDGSILTKIVNLFRGPNHGSQSGFASYWGQRKFAFLLFLDGSRVWK